MKIEMVLPEAGQRSNIQTAKQAEEEGFDSLNILTNKEDLDK
jgi:hypothetical protein